MFLSPIATNLCFARVMATFSKFGLEEAHAAAALADSSNPKHRITPDACLPWNVCTVPT